MLARLFSCLCLRWESDTNSELLEFFTETELNFTAVIFEWNFFHNNPINLMLVILYLHYLTKVRWLWSHEVTVVCQLMLKLLLCKETQPNDLIFTIPSSLSLKYITRQHPPQIVDSGWGSCGEVSSLPRTSSSQLQPQPCVCGRQGWRCNPLLGKYTSLSVRQELDMSANNHNTQEFQ